MRFKDYISEAYKEVVDQKSLEEVGNIIAKKMGVKRKIKWRWWGSQNPGFKARWNQDKGLIQLSTAELKTQKEIRGAIAHELLHSFPKYHYMPPGMSDISLEELSKLSDEEFNKILPFLKRARNHPKEFHTKLDSIIKMIEKDA